MIQPKVSASNVKEQGKSIDALMTFADNPN
jgi:hypothetical protein